MIATALSFVCAGIWLYLLWARGDFWDVREEAAYRAEGAPPAKIVAVVPARDEAASIALSVTSLLAQDYPVHVVLADDHSTDGTARIAFAAAERMGALERLTIVTARDLPPGWTGKLWAVSEGLEQARSLAPDYVLLTDADITHAPSNVGSLVTRAERDHLDLTSLMVRLRCESFPEKLLIPAFVFFFFKLYPPRWVADNSDTTAAAAGGCMLVRWSALDNIGGIGTIRGELIDDCALARAMKARGPIWMGVTSKTHSIRAYDTFNVIWKMIARSAFTQLEYSWFYLLGSCAAMLITYVLPAVLPFWVTPSSPVWILAVLPAACMFVSYSPTLRFYGRSEWWAVLMPLVGLFYTGATIHSAWLHWRGAGGEWKGRVQAPLG